MSILSVEDFEETAKIHWYPLIKETIARLNPVFPEVVSIIVSPCFKIPFLSADSTICKAILSFEECPGLADSSFARKVPAKSLVSLFILTMGVFPTSSNKLLTTFLFFFI